jgi:hypothetical protein
MASRWAAGTLNAGSFIACDADREDELEAHAQDADVGGCRLVQHARRQAVPE